MIFQRVTITDLFSYCGEQTYDFTADPARPVALIVGRNGFGKTSLLNAVKLLFLGSDDRTQRQVGFPPRNLSRNDYVLGTPHGWAGILNRHARNAGRNYGSIRVELGEAGRVLLAATRSWVINGRSFEEELTVREAGQQEVKNDAAEERLSKLLPRELVPFFFFDGEELQFLAEGGDDVRAQAMERLLSLSFLTGVETQLGEVVKDLRKNDLPAEVKVEIAAAEGRLATLGAEAQALRQRCEELRREIAETRDHEDGQRRRMEALRREGTVANTRHLEGEIKALEGELETDLSDLANDLATDAPLLANPALVNAAQSAVAEVVEFKTRAATSVAATLRTVLPERLFVEPPQPRAKLTDDQRRFFEDKLHRILDSYAVADTGSPPFLDSLDLTRARTLRERFTRWNAAMATQRQDRARRLKQASARRARLERLRAEQRETQFGIKERADDYHRLESEFAEIIRARGRLEAALDQHEAKLAAKQGEERECEASLRTLQSRHERARKAGEKLRIAIDLRDTFQVFRQKSRAARRGQIEEAVNRHFRRLMTGHHMIERIVIDQDFVMRFHDADGEEFGQLTVSHGMRQLAVTALLWALKEVSGRALPIMVDTPLARIDRENQHNLLRLYYPHAAEQVIILATDSEIDAEKFAVLREHVGVRFTLDNPDGQTTRVPAPERVHG